MKNILSKTIFLSIIITCLLGCNKNDQWVDLGLPSCTKWNKENVKGYYSHDKAIKRFKKNLPTDKQWKELKDYCKWEWNVNGYTITAPNGNQIFLPASGRKYGKVVDEIGTNGYYWGKSDLYEEPVDFAYYFDFNGKDNYVMGNYWNLVFSVRLVRN